MTFFIREAAGTSGKPSSFMKEERGKPAMYFKISILQHANALLLPLLGPNRRQ